MDTRFDFKSVEEKWSRAWEESGVFHAALETEKPRFTIVIPPPNITSHLHLGHAFQNGFLDLMIRWKKMSGFETCWLPGTDHAGIATQNVVERELRKEKLSRHDLGREAFVARVWEWRKVYGDRITNQMRRLGYALDWPRERFTLDEGLSAAVTEQFVRLYEEGLIRRDYRIINWCPRCETALSDIEVEYEDEQGQLYHIFYPLFEEGKAPNSEGEGLVVATTRPETMLGDSAVAVNPEDKRHKGWGGRHVHLPLTGRTIPVIQDSYVDMAFGTGALKVTPAHDPNDFNLGKKHRLKMINIFTPRARINEEGGVYKGLNREEARKRIVEDLKAQGLLRKVEPLAHRVGHCERCKAVVEPYHSRQWFVSMKGMADKALKSVQKGEVRFHPENWTKVFEHWMEIIHDWCISRQLWWGHRIPAWFCQKGDHTVVARTAPASCPQCGGELKQDEDVLDTWFSSNLWPFSSLGWPAQTPDLQALYPTSVLGTGWDIIFFWVAKMIMAGLHFTGQVPFRDVYLNSLVGDEKGKKMSKSSGTAPDPLKVIDEYGADCLRFALVASETRSHYIPFSVDKVRGYRNFVTKIWNATRFSMQYLQGQDAPTLSPGLPPGGINSGGPSAPLSGRLPHEGEGLELWDHWIWSRLIHCARTTQEAFEGYRFNEAALVQADFFWHQLCDVYLEALKFRFRSNDSQRAASARFILGRSLKTSLKLMHPIMPFVTEELWSLLGSTETPPPHGGGARGEGGSSAFLCQETWPLASELEGQFKPDPDKVGNAEFILALAAQIRSLRSDAKVHPKDATPVLIQAPASSRLKDLLGLTEVRELLSWETRAGALALEDATAPAPAAGAAPDPLRGCRVGLSSPG